MLSAMILTGGNSSRFGSDKSQAMMGKISLLEALLATLPPESEIVVVGPEIKNAPRFVKYTQESPKGAGPVAAIAAGLKLVETEFVAIIATDMPFASQVLDSLAKHLPITKDALIPLDAQGVRQSLCAIYRVDSLLNAIAILGDTQGQSMRNLTHLLSVMEVRLDPSLERILLDVDTPEDLRRAIILGQEIGKVESVEIMDKWIEAVKKELGVNIDIDHGSILDVARDAAHAIERKAAPITTFLLGFAVAAGADAKEATKKIADLAKNWPADK